MVTGAGVDGLIEGLEKIPLVLSARIAHDTVALEAQLIRDNPSQVIIREACRLAAGGAARHTVQCSVTRSMAGKAWRVLYEAVN